MQYKSISFSADQPYHATGIFRYWKTNPTAPGFKIKKTGKIPRSVTV
jgi:hypothetical protein